MKRVVLGGLLCAGGCLLLVLLSYGTVDASDCIKGAVTNDGEACNLEGHDCASVCILTGDCGSNQDDCAPVQNKKCTADENSAGCCKNTGLVACTNTAAFWSCYCYGILGTGICYPDEDTATMTPCDGNKATAVAC